MLRGYSENCPLGLPLNWPPARKTGAFVFVRPEGGSPRQPGIDFDAT
jgi:hypothetical protein